jgi:hypothetical protein
VRARRLAVIAALATLLAAAPAQGASSGFVIGLYNAVNPYAAAHDLGVRWVRQFVGWDLAEPTPGHFNGFYLAELRAEVEAFRRLGVRVALVTVRTPAWASPIAGNGAPSQPASYAAFVARLARALPHVAAIEVWNEADDGIFWAGGASPRAYTPVLRTAYRAIKRANPRVTVLTTGMVANDYDFLRGLYAAGARGSFDAVAVHTDTACLTAPPTYFYREPSGRIGRYSFTGYRALHALMRRHGDGRKRIWITEMGWSTASTAPNSCTDGARAGTKPAGVGEPEQAQMLTLAYRCLARDRYVKAALWFDLQDIGDGPSYDQHLGLVRRDGTQKPAYAAMRAVRGGHVSPLRCGGRARARPR